MVKPGRFLFTKVLFVWKLLNTLRKECPQSLLARHCEPACNALQGRKYIMKTFSEHGPDVVWHPQSAPISTTCDHLLSQPDRSSRPWNSCQDSMEEIQKEEPTETFQWVWAEEDSIRAKVLCTQSLGLPWCSLSPKSLSQLRKLLGSIPLNHKKEIYRVKLF